MTNFEKTAKTGTYAVRATSAKSGRKFRLTVTKSEEGNPSARGGAYRTVWVAKHGFTKATGETRKGALENLLRAMKDEHGIDLEV